MNDQLLQCDERKLTEMLKVEENGPQHDEWVNHIEQCGHCQARLRDLAADDDDWRKASEVLTKEEGEDEPLLSPRGRDRPTNWTESMVSHLLKPPTHPEMLGRLGRYEIERLIGSGGMGIVFKAFDTELNRPVAVKILAPHLASSLPARQRFAREARSAAGIVDDHVVPIFNVESEGEPPFLVMQYVAGGSLQEKLDRDGPLEVTDILRIGLQTAKGLAAAHAQGLIHRDVKPSNVLLDEGVERALITDFGLARAEDEVSLTHTGFHPGTPHYMSPEQVRGESIDARSDLFSLGCVLYALCTGRPPFRADTSYAVLRKVTDDKPRPIQDNNPQLPEWLGRIVMKLLAKSRADRFSSAREVADLLESCLAHVHQPTDVPLPESLRAPTPRLWHCGTRMTGLSLFGVASIVAAAAMMVQNDGDHAVGGARNESESAKATVDEASAPAAAQRKKSTADTKSTDNDEARREFIKLVRQYDGQFVFVPATSPEVPKENKSHPADDSGGVRKPATTKPHVQVNTDDVAVHVEALLLFEEGHRGTHLGLMALRKLLTDTWTRALSNDQETSPRSRAMERLVHYADRPILSEMLFHVVNANFDRSTENALRAIIDAPNVSKFVRPSAQLNLSAWMLSFKPFVVHKQRIAQQIEDLTGDEAPVSQKTLSILKRQSATAPDAATFAKWNNEAVATLEKLRDTATEIHIPGVKAAGNQNIVRISHDLTKETPTLSEQADRILKRRVDPAGNPGAQIVKDAKEVAVRQEFIQLVETFDRHFQQATNNLTPISATNDESAIVGIMANGILPVELESLLLFEEQYRGDTFGLMALRHIIAHSKRYGLPPEDVRSANARAIKRLQHYASQPMLAPVLMLVGGNSRGMSGFAERQTEGALRAVLKSSKLSDTVRPVAQLALCNWMLCFEGFVDNRTKLLKQIEQLNAKTTPKSKHETRMLEALLAATPNEEVFRGWKAEAMELLESLERTATDVRLPGVKVDGHLAILSIDPMTTLANETISEIASKIRRERSSANTDKRSR